MLTITRRHEFDYGHRVLGHEGKCRFVHGHRGVAEISVRSAKLDDVGRIIDFGALKDIFGGWLDLCWDHNLLLNSLDPIGHTAVVGPFVLKGQQPFIFKEQNPTAEVMATLLGEKIWPLLVVENPRLAGMELVQIKLYETPKSWAIYQPNPEASRP